MLRRLLLLGTALLPFNVLRIACLRLLFGHRISLSSRVGFLTLLDCDTVELREARIGPFNFIHCGRLEMEPGSRILQWNAFRNLGRIHLGEGAFVGNHNRFFGPAPGTSPFGEESGLVLGRLSIITTHHSFDLTDSILIGSDVTLGGCQTQVWTHGFDLGHIRIQAPVVIGDNVYIGSRCMILAGVQVCGGVSIGAGTVVSTSIASPGFYVSSHLQRKADARSYDECPGVVEYKGARFVRK